jgi:hypothetical protein
MFNDISTNVSRRSRRSNLLVNRLFNHQANQPLPLVNLPCSLVVSHRASLRVNQVTNHLSNPRRCRQARQGNPLRNPHVNRRDSQHQHPPHPLVNHQCDLLLSPQPNLRHGLQYNHQCNLQLNPHRFPQNL